MEKLTKRVFAGMVDCVDLAPTITRQEILQFVNDVAQRDFRNIATPYCYHPWVFQELQRLGKDKTIGVLGGGGFPDGNWTTSAKLASVERCLELGCSEFDLTANLGWIKSGMWDEVMEEVHLVRQIIGQKPLKVICHVPLLTEKEIAKMCGLLIDCGEVDFLKTATGREGAPTSLESVRLIKSLTAGKLKVKVSGGVRQLEKVQQLYEIGVERLGMSHKYACQIYDALEP